MSGLGRAAGVYDHSVQHVRSEATTTTIVVVVVVEVLHFVVAVPVCGVLIATFTVFLLNWQLQPQRKRYVVAELCAAIVAKVELKATERDDEVPRRSNEDGAATRTAQQVITTAIAIG